MLTLNVLFWVNSMITPFSLDTLNDLARDFAKWRASRTNKTGKIPNHLWDKVFAMLEDHSVAEITKALGVSSSQISDKIKQRDARGEKTKPSTTDSFMEFNLTSPTPSSPPVVDSFSRIEIRRPDGSVLTVAHLPQQTIMQVLNQFTQAV